MRGAPENRGRAARFAALVIATLASLLPIGDVHAQSARGHSVRVFVGSPGDHWADTLGYTYIGRDTQDGRYGYKVSFRAADGCEMTIFWPRETIDFRGDAPGYRLYRMRVPTGWFWYPSRLTAKSLPQVYEGIQYIEAYYARQADGAIAAAQGFALVAAMGSLAPAPRVPMTAPRTAVRSMSGAGRVAAARATVELPTALKGGSRNVHVYLGVRNGRPVYVGISKDVVRRQAEHRSRFVLQRITPQAVTRGEARAIEQALISRNPGFENIRNSIDPSKPYFRQAVDWGEAWLKSHGF